jgi:four helix bundle protein
LLKRGNWGRIKSIRSLKSVKLIKSIKLRVKMVVKIEKFEDIVVWQKARVFSVEIYNTFRYCRDYAFKDQIQRATVSIMNNIAEGYERKGDREFRKFLYISKGSSAEVRSMLFLSLDLRYIDKNKFESLHDQSLEISKMLSGFIKKLNQSG